MTYLDTGCFVKLYYPEADSAQEVIAHARATRRRTFETITPSARLVRSCEKQRTSAHHFFWPLALAA